jgi:hypothetical protein
MKPKSIDEAAVPDRTWTQFKKNQPSFDAQLAAREAQKPKPRREDKSVEGRPGGCAKAGAYGCVWLVVVPLLLAAALAALFSR